MKIYFHCSLVGKEQYLKEFNTIVGFLKRFNNEVFADHILKRDYRILSKGSKDEIYKDIQNQKKLIKSCDAVVIESTYPSIGVGYIIAYAIAQFKSVLVLYQQTPHAILLSEKDRLLTIKKYSIMNEKRLLHDLRIFLENAKKKILKYRFNMMIDQTLNDLLSLETSKLHTSKADYVRQLIFEKLVISKQK